MRNDRVRNTIDTATIMPSYRGGQSIAEIFGANREQVLLNVPDHDGHHHDSRAALLIRHGIVPTLIELHT
ncbi:unnamed protein product [Nippostrongylus brasiliensis]|uniref:Transposase n=1 Tax=Nippostrongylus brasiliensis TaxID=27835 RepID=A0A0N4YGJ8_NIPBR|nr:unnamed protein product [Nippostrongylus brasiliensis]